ncbi:hypothetical protein [Curtobacterium flaccumfaciens]|uniref:hypothetical protein n=1 Tax=Curtobacterium flaccumfaciens TaxID=2035 RepID=UPI00220B5C54|nr:hypothetical protein [Curtobacterium flaccumfaciens]MCS5518622.1 hypothetical protein [Curtobacterium flaccumfaciens]UWD78682.1 hypothetical protein NY058_14920 [Curtobacterium flaccumfaciens]
MVANTLLELDALPAVISTHPETAEAARRLRGTHESVQGLFTTLHDARAQKIARGAEVRRLGHGETDLLRSAIVFAGAGLDSVLKQLVRDSLDTLLVGHPGTRTSLSRFVVNTVKDEPKKATRILAATSADAQLRIEYVEHLTKGSLQSERDLQAVRDALGIDPTGTFADAAFNALRPFFDARNQIVHELDLQLRRAPGDTTRRVRRMAPSRDLANEAVQTCAAFVIATDALL